MRELTLEQIKSKEYNILIWFHKLGRVLYKWRLQKSNRME